MVWQDAPAVVFPCPSRTIIIHNLHDASCGHCAYIVLHSSFSDFKLMIWSAEKHELVQKEIQNGALILKIVDVRIL